MRFWERFSKTIYRILLIPFRKQIEKNSFESVLKRSLQLFDEEVLTEILDFLKREFTNDGAFADRGGKADIYYSLFGLFISEAIDEKQHIEGLKAFVKTKSTDENLTDVHVFCLSVMYAKLFGLDKQSDELKRQVVAILKKGENEQFQYITFLGILALYYLQEYRLVWKYLKRQNNHSVNTEMNVPCTVLAAETVVLKLAGKRADHKIDRIQSYYKDNGGFLALQKSPIEDMLTTSVALFALNFGGYDLRLIKPACLDFIDNLYDNGGFYATVIDNQSDVEYTFYGLLALGVLNTPNES